MTNCHQFLFFFFGKLKHELIGKTTAITPHLPVQIFCFNAVQASQVSVDHDLLTADQKYLINKIIRTYLINVIPAEAGIHIGYPVLSPTP